MQVGSFKKPGNILINFYLCFYIPTWYQSPKKINVSNMSSSSSSSSSSPTILTSSQTPTVTPISNIVSLKLTQDNYSLWKTQLLHYFRGQDLYGYLDRTLILPLKLITTQHPDTCVAPQKNERGVAATLPACGGIQCGGV